jgi:aconitate hydratase
VHQHVQSRRAARRGPARQEGGRARPQSAQAHQDVAGARLAHGHRLPHQANLLPYLEQLGFNVAAYGCTTCIGNAGDLAPEINDAIVSNDLICAAVLSGNRNFEARIHPNLKANFLASPPLVVAYAIAGTMLRDLTTEPLGIGSDGVPVFLREIWPTSHEIAAVSHFARDPAVYRKLYGNVANANPMWALIKGTEGQVYHWPTSTYIAKPPFFDAFTMRPGAMTDIRGARALGIFGDSITTDHISPAARSRRTRPPASGSSSTTSPRPTSTATARGAATTR